MSEYSEAVIQKMGDFDADFDAEAGHVHADELLIEALRHYVPEADKIDIEVAIECYEAMERWYA